MKITGIILSLFLLCSCSDTLDDPFMMAGVGSLLRPAQNYPLGSDAALSYSFEGVSYEDPMAHYWDFEKTGDLDYLETTNIDAMEADSYTVVGMVHLETVADDHTIAAQYAANQISWYMYSNDDNHLAGSGANACNAGSTNTDANVLNNAEALLMAMTFDYSGNAGVGDSTMINWTRRIAGMVSEVKNNAIGPVPDCTGTFSIGRINGFPGVEMDGKLYWVAYYASVLVQQDLEDLYDGTKHPATDFTPVMYWDGSKAVAATYTTEVGDYVLTVFGTPVQGP